MTKSTLFIIFLCGVCCSLQSGSSLHLQSLDEDTFESMDVPMELNNLKKTVALLQEKISSMEQLESAISTNSETPVPRTKTIPRTCDELRALEPQLPSGEYFIDPDGYGRGHNPILVYCNMKSGSTIISHNNENPVNVTQCRNPGCSSHSISYKANMKQIIALIEMSGRCRQQIQYQCINAPLHLDGIDNGWWNDRHGNPHYYWTGSNHSIHTCQCGILSECVDSSVNCNCDANYPEQQTDRGYVSDKQALPITGLHFGLTYEEHSWGRFLLGKFECSGSFSPPGMPESCQDLWRIGHTLSGFYTVWRDNSMQTVYCDMSKLPGETGFQQTINNTVRSAGEKSSVYFSVSSHQELKISELFVPYGVELLNRGKAMDLSTGLFTAPKSGIYYFSFDSLANENKIDTRCCMKHNDKVVGCAWASGRSEALPISAILPLSEGDQVGVYMDLGVLFSSGNAYTRFSGFLLDESP